MNDSATVVPLSLGMVRVFLLRGKQTVLVDTGQPGHAAAILAGLAEQGLSGSDVSLLLLTHGHVDHAGSAGELRALTGAPIAMHRGDVELLRQGANIALRPVGLVGRLASWLFWLQKSATPPAVEPDILLEGETDLAGYGVAARVIPTPGHTPGSISVALADGQVMVGDLLMGSLLWRRPSYPLFADDMARLRQSIKKVMELAPTRVWPAHGGPFEPEAIWRRFPWSRGEAT